MSLKFCSLASGSSGNCQYVESNEVRILVDAGLSGKKIQQLLDDIEVDPSSIDYIFITHEHSDHIKGVGVLSRRFDIPVYANQRTWEGIGNSIGSISTENRKVFKTDEKFCLGDVDVLPFKIYHDAAEPVGYTFTKDDKKVSLLTDTGIVCERIKDTIKNSDVILIEANHDVEMVSYGKYPYYLKRRILSDEGHISNETCGEIIKEINDGTDKIYLLAHLSNENNTPKLAYDTVVHILKEAEVTANIEMTHRDRTSKFITINK